MYVSKFALMTAFKSSLKWGFFYVLYPYVVMSLVYGGGASATGLLFSYITIVPTLLVIKLVKELKERSVDLNEYLAIEARGKFTDEEYANVIVALKVARKVILVLIGLGCATLLLKLFAVSSVISASLNSFLIALLQVYYIAILVARIKYEA